MSAGRRVKIEGKRGERERERNVEEGKKGRKGKGRKEREKEVNTRCKISEHAMS